MDSVGVQSLDVSGASTLKATTVDGSLSTITLDVTGGSTLKDATIDGSLNVTGDASVMGSLDLLNSRVSYNSVFKTDFAGKSWCTHTIQDMVPYPIADTIGLIVSSSGTYNDIQNQQPISVNDAVPIVSLAAIDNDTSVYGVVSMFVNSLETSIGGISISYEGFSVEKVVVNTMGHGGMWVCDIRGDLSKGDLISSCIIPGYGALQDSEPGTVKNYTVAKITCDCAFVSQDEEIEYGGQFYKRRFVGCAYY